MNDYDALLHSTGAVPPHAMTLVRPHAHPAHPPAPPPVHDARPHDPHELARMQAEVNSLRHQVSNLHQAPAHHPQHHPHHHPAQPAYYPVYAPEPARHAAPPPPPHAEHAPRRHRERVTHADDTRNFPVGFIRTQVPAGQTAEIEVKPQVRFQGHRLAVAQSAARYFNIVDIKVGKDSQLAATGEMPAEAFSSLSVDTQVELDPAPPGIVITLIVRNIWPTPRDFGAVLYGTVEEVNE